ncbi:O-methylsterigmatocystin oxidoreductase [Termitomyces sp. J132]|nr:O-methylsterigmatocystin oxidoreductase [Termitomyces sp. J132]
MILDISEPTLSALFAFVATIALLLLYQNRKQSQLPLPPGPRRIPLLGNVTDFTLKELWITATRWSVIYGDVCHLQVLNWHIIFASSPEVVDELLDKRGAIYSDRPTLQMSGQLCGVEKMVNSLSIPRWTCVPLGSRRYIQQTLGPRSIPAYHSMIQDETAVFLRALLYNPANYLSDIRKYAGGLTLAVVYGYKVKSVDDKYLMMAEECLAILANEIASGSGIWPVDIFPVLNYIPEWFPGASFKRKAAIWKPKMAEFIRAPFEYSKSAARDGTILPSFCSKFLTEDTLETAMENDLMYSANSMYAASADTTVTSISQFILAMTLHPEVMRRAQQEIDDVVGPDRLPNFKDRSSLPYVEAVMSEVWRWGVPTPLNLPHYTSQDDLYRGMYIPKNSIVIANIWAILRDENLFPNPNTFDPSHFYLVQDAELKKRRDPRNYIFGFGRRRCPGADLVESSVWLLIVSVLATMDIKKKMDQNGNIIEPKISYNNSIFRVPDKFDFDIEPRSLQGLSLTITETGLSS